MTTRHFDGLASFAAFMGRATVREVVGDRLARGMVASTIAEHARGRIGDPTKFTPLKPETIARKTTGDAPLLETGELRESIGWAHEGVRKTVVGSTDPKAAFHEMGGAGDHPPKRPFLASTFNDRALALRELYLVTLQKVFEETR